MPALLIVGIILLVVGSHWFAGAATLGLILLIVGIVGTLWGSWPRR